MRQTDGICRNYSPANSVCGFMKNLRINAAISNGGSEHRRYFHRMPGRRRLQSHGQLPAFHKQRWTLCPVQWYRPPFSAWPTDQRLRPAHSGHDNTHHSALDCFRHGLKKRIYRGAMAAHFFTWHTGQSILAANTDHTASVNQRVQPKRVRDEAHHHSGPPALPCGKAGSTGQHTFW